MRISIAMATFNGARYLGEQLASFADQTLLPDELVACDDGSTDDTLTVLEAFAKTAPFEVLIHRNPVNLGYGRNFAKALGLCTGDLVFPSDQDDVWFPERLAVIHGLADADPGKLLWMNDAELTDEKLRPTGLTKLGQLKGARIKSSSFVQGCCCAVRRELLDRALPIPEAFTAHDGWLVELAGYLDVKVILGRSLQFYRIHGRNTSGFFVNRTAPVGFFDKVRGRMASAGREQIRRELGSERGKVEALEARIRSTKGGSPDRALAVLSDKRAALQLRSRLIEKPKLLRILSAVPMLMKGDYARHFNGVDSFLKDLIV